MQTEKIVKCSERDVIVREIKLRDIVELGELWKDITTEGKGLSVDVISDHFAKVLAKSTDMSITDFQSLRFSDLDIIEKAWRELNTPFLNRCGGMKNLLERLKILPVVASLFENWVREVQEKTLHALGSKEQ